MPIPIAVLASGGGTTLQNLIDRINAGSLDAQVRLVLASRPGIRAIERAQAAKISVDVVQPSEVFAKCETAGVHLICLGGWLSMLHVPERWLNRVMNIHPALLPSPFGGKGMFGQRVHAAVLDHGCKITGCTVHFVDNDYDNGPIILQKCCEVREDDSPQSLSQRVATLEHETYPQAIQLFAQGRLSVENRRVRIRHG